MIAGLIKARLEIPGAAKRTTEHNYIQFLYTPEDSEQAEQESIEEPKASIKTNFLFDVNIKSIKTSNSQLQELAQEVTQIVTREKVELTIADSRPFLLKTLSKIPKILDRSSEKHKKLDRMVEFRIEANPSAEDIKEIIESCSIEISPNDREHTNVGFVTKTGKIKWSDEYRLTKDFRLDSNGHHILPSSLTLEKLQLERAQIMPLLEDDKTVDATSITAIAAGA